VSAQTSAPGRISIPEIVSCSPTPARRTRSLPATGSATPTARGCRPRLVVTIEVDPSDARPQALIDSVAALAPSVNARRYVRVRRENALGDSA
jgi:hypothetical protein